MFEKESQDYAMREVAPRQELYIKGRADIDADYEKVKKIWQDGAEFGYNKANEWHYLSKGEYPKEYEDILICFLTEEDMRDCVRGWYEYDYENNKHIFKYLNVLGTQYLETVYAWKEIVLPKESE